MFPLPTAAPFHAARSFAASKEGAEKRTVADIGASRGPRLIRFLLLALPALWVGTLIYRYGVNSPWLDQWDGMAHLFEKDAAGTLGYADFFAFHNEHRAFFPRLLMFALAQFTGWNIRAELGLIWLLLCVCAVNLCALAHATASPNQPRAAWLLLASNVLLFTPLQWENLLWGFQVGFLLPLASTIAAIACAATARRTLVFPLTLLFCVVSTFSIASGFASFVLAAPVLWSRLGQPRCRSDKLSWAIWIGAAITSVALYFHGFSRPPGHPSALATLAQPVGALQFLLTYLGSAFAAGPLTAQVVGAALVVSLGLCLGGIWRRRAESDVVRKAMPWLAIAGIALGNGALTTIGRFGFGLTAALPPRYVSFSIMLPIALLFLGVVLLQKAPRLFRIGTVIVGVVFGCLLLAGTVRSLEVWARFQHKRLAGKSVLLLSNILDEPEAWKRSQHWAGLALRPRARLLDELGFLHPRLLRTRDIRAIADHAAGETAGELTTLRRVANDKLEMGGWAVLPAKRRIADSVLLACENEAGQWLIFARVDVGLSVPAIRDRFGDDFYLHSGWTKTCETGSLPPGARRISAWSFDADEARAFPLGTLPL